MNTAIFSQLFKKKMTRKEFLLYVGTLCLAITGFSALVKTISDPQLSKNRPKPTAGFGAGPYGA